MKDSSQRYGVISRLLHWTMAGLIAWQFLKLGDRINEGEHWIGQTLVPWHLSIGVLLLLLIVLRLFWTLRQKQRPQPEAATALLVKAGHGLLYASMLLMPLTGILLMIGNGYGLSVFGLELVAESETQIAWMAAVGSLHATLAKLLLVLVVGHIGAALFHRFVKKDDALQRMIG